MDKKRGINQKVTGIRIRISKARNRRKIKRHYREKYPKNIGNQN